jgi:hypothetical protein
VGCLLGGLALDVAETDPVLRERLAGLFDRWRARLAETPAAGPARGSAA